MDFQDDCHGGHLGFLIKMISAYFLLTSHSDTSNYVSSQLAFPFRRRSSKIDFQDGHHATILDFRLKPF